MKKNALKVAEEFGRSCQKNDIVALGMTMNDNNTNNMVINATGYEAGFMIRQLVRQLLNVYSDNLADRDAFIEELLKLNLRD